MKKLLIFLYQGTHSTRAHLIDALAKNYMLARHSSITVENYKNAEDDFLDAFNALVNAIKGKRTAIALQALDAARVLYRKHGEKPTENSSGYYEMIRFLNEVEEAIVTIATEQGSDWSEIK